MTALCNSCEKPYDANDFCPRCEHYASEQLPEKTLDQLFDEYPAVRAYRDALRSRLWGFDVLGEQLTETRGDPFGDAAVGERVAVRHELNPSYDCKGELEPNGRWACENAFVVPPGYLVWNPTHWHPLAERVSA